jgi:hypothetical protein
MPWSIGFATLVSVDNSIYADLLDKYVDKGRVDYDGFKKEEARLDNYLKLLEGVRSAELSRDERFAFYTNAYNAWTIKLILSKYPEIESIKDLGSLFKSPWKRKIVRIDGEVLTLDNVEHDILRPRFKDARVHFVINCAAHSCPPLGDEPLRGTDLDTQLDEATRKFINNPKRNYLDENILYVSKIFKWFAEDFNDDLISFIVRYAKDEFEKNLEASKDRIKVKYLPYDWSLNNRPQ